MTAVYFKHEKWDTAPVVLLFSSPPLGLFFCMRFKKLYLFFSFLSFTAKQCFCQLPEGTPPPPQSNDFHMGGWGRCQRTTCNNTSQTHLISAVWDGRQMFIKDINSPSNQRTIRASWMCFHFAWDMNETTHHICCCRDPFLSSHSEVSKRDVSGGLLSKSACTGSYMPV